MAFTSACSNAIQRSKALGTVCRVYQSFNTFYVNSDKERAMMVRLAGFLWHILVVEKFCRWPGQSCAGN